MMEAVIAGIMLGLAYIIGAVVSTLYICSEYDYQDEDGMGLVTFWWYVCFAPFILLALKVRDLYDKARRR